MKDQAGKLQRRISRGNTVTQGPGPGVERMAGCHVVPFLPKHGFDRKRGLAAQHQMGDPGRSVPAPSPGIEEQKTAAKLQTPVGTENHAGRRKGSCRVLPDFHGWRNCRLCDGLDRRMGLDRAARSGNGQRQCGQTTRPDPALARAHATRVRIDGVRTAAQSGWNRIGLVGPAVSHIGPQTVGFAGGVRHGLLELRNGHGIRAHQRCHVPRMRSAIATGGLG